MTPDIPPSDDLLPEDQSVESLSDDQLELELTVAAHDPVRRRDHYEALIREWLIRHRGYGRRRDE